MTTGRFSINSAEMLFPKLILIAQTQIKLLTETFLISGKTNKQQSRNNGVFGCQVKKSNKKLKQQQQQPNKLYLNMAHHDYNFE